MTNQQTVKKPKLLTAAFGDKGSFSYDSLGSFVIVQGWAWPWIGGTGSQDNEGDDEDIESLVALPFDAGGLPWAYMAILNSSVFGISLLHFCPRVQGGEFHLDNHFVREVFLPDLTDENVAASDDVRLLKEAGTRTSFGCRGRFGNYR